MGIGMHAFMRSGTCTAMRPGTTVYRHPCSRTRISLITPAHAAPSKTL